MDMNQKNYSPQISQVSADQEQRKEIYRKGR